MLMNFPFLFFTKLGDERLRSTDMEEESIPNVISRHKFESCPSLASPGTSQQNYCHETQDTNEGKSQILIISCTRNSLIAHFIHSN